MRQSQKASLFRLIKSLTKSEKRQFKLYVNRLGNNSNSKYLSLFNLIDKMKIYNELEISRANVVKKDQLSNVKAHLHKQILISLRLSISSNSKRLQLREQLDYVYILYNKGLYDQSLQMLHRVKSLALKLDEKIVAFHAIEFEKIIQTQYLTQSSSDKASVLAKDSNEIALLNMLSSSLSSLSLSLYTKIVQSGYVKSDKEFKEVTQFFQDNIRGVDMQTAGFNEKFWFYKSHLLYSMLVQDLLAAYKFANKWVELFYLSPQMIELHPVFFIRGHQHLFELLYLLKYRSKFKEALKKFEETLWSSSFPMNNNISPYIFMGRYHNKINLHFLEGSFEEALPLISTVLDEIAIHRDQLDQHHIMVLYYKIACIYFGVGNYLKCIEYLQKIISDKSLRVHQDLMCFSRVLNVVAHYDAGLDYQLEKQVKQTYKFLLKMNELQTVQKEMIRFLRSLTDIYPSELKQSFQNLHNTLKSYENDPYEKRSFLYLDILSWLESKIENRPIGEVIRQKASLLIR
jgi:tetratricopeptide (TPR) repeat protein